jgi:flagellar biosynthesis anti-sigma factor FlgM
MKVNRPPGADLNRVHATTVRTSAPTPAQAAAGRSADELRLSSKAQEVNRLRAKLQEQPDVRMDLVERFKREIAAGEYRPDSQAVAAKLLEIRVLEQ